MALPRFHHLPLPRQRAILDAALDEFAAHGFGTASLNRIIDASGISKGSMYYYFSDKEQLYADVIRLELERVMERAGPFPPPPARDADGYWSTLEDHYLRLMRTLLESPKAAALLRDWLSGPVGPSLLDAQHDAERELLPWLTQTIAIGQRIGAVRSDVEPELVIAVVMGMGRAMDAWLIRRPPGSRLADDVRILMTMLRRAVSSD